MGAEVRLREFREGDLPFLDRLVQDPAATGVFEWGGFRDSRSRRRRFELDGYVGAESVGLAITLADDAEAGPVGVAGWHCNLRHQAGVCYEIGVGLLPEHRGRGLGTATHHALVSHLFRFTTAHRLEAITDAENWREQRALERSGFTLEGRRREVYFQFGTWRDQMIYGLLRSEATVSQAVTVP